MQFNDIFLSIALFPFLQQYMITIALLSIFALIGLAALSTCNSMKTVRIQPDTQKRKNALWFSQESEFLDVQIKKKRSHSWYKTKCGDAESKRTFKKTSKHIPHGSHSFLSTIWSLTNALQYLCILL